MESTDLTVRILQEIRDGVRELSDRMETGFRESNARFEAMNERFNQRFEAMDQRFEVIETTLRDLAEQMVMLSRGVKFAIEARGKVDERLDEHERRLAEIEKRLPQ